MPPAPAALWAGGAPGGTPSRGWRCHTAPPRGTQHPPVIEQGEELAGVVQVVLGHPAEAKLVEVAEGDGGEGLVARRLLLQLGAVGVLEVQAHALGVDVDEEAERAQEGQQPEQVAGGVAPVPQDVLDAVQRAAAGELLQAARPLPRGCRFSRRLGEVVTAHGAPSRTALQVEGCRGPSGHPGARGEPAGFLRPHAVQVGAR